MAAFVGALPNKVMLLLIDNYDSFVQNLAVIFDDLVVRQLSYATMFIALSNSCDGHNSKGLSYRRSLHSNEAGCSLELVRRLPNNLPLLGFA